MQHSKRSKLLATSLIIGALAFVGIESDASAGHTGGTVMRSDTVFAGMTDTYTEAFYPGMSVVEVKGDGDTDIDCFVTDMSGNFVTGDSNPSDYCYLRFMVIRGGYFHVHVRNYGDVYNDYVIRMQ